MSLNIIVFLVIAGFIAAFVDSIAGGGGLISLPALIMAGVSPQLSLGTNKFASTCASFTSVLTFARSKKIYFPLIKYQIPFTLLGTILGVKCALNINQDLLRVLIVVLVCIVAVYTFLKKDFGSKENFKGLTAWNISYGCAFAMALGFYDGFFGPGTGTFLIFLFITIFGFDFTVSAGNGKILNFTSNIASLVLFAFYGKVYYLAGIPMALAMIIGARLGTKMAINNGHRIIKPIYIIIAVLFVGKLAFRVVTGHDF